MGEIIDQINAYKEMADPVLDVARSMGVPVDKWISVPLAQLTTLGDSVSSMIAEVNNVTRTANEAKQTLFQLANGDVGDALKMVKGGDFWEAFKNPGEGQKIAQIKELNPASGASSMAMKVNPATMMMAVALFSIEKELGDIEETQKQILSFLETEKQAEIETDVSMLTKIVAKYKDNWDDERYINTKLNTVDVINRTASKNIRIYRTKVEDLLKKKKLVVIGKDVNSTLADMQKSFKYYRLSLYSFSLSSFAEIMLSGNFKEENIQTAISEINKASDDYISLFGECSDFLAKLAGGSVQTNFLKGAGAASNAMGRLIGNIPKVKDTQANDFLIGKGEKFKDSAQKGSLEVVESFAEMSDPNTEGILKQLEDMNQIYNKTTGICFDKDNLYLVTEGSV